MADESVPPFALNDPLAAMREALARAEKAAQDRAEAKAAKRRRQASQAEGEWAEAGGVEALEALASEALAELNGPTAPLLNEGYAIDEDEDLDLLVALAAKDLQEESREERHGDLVVVREPVAPPAWYTEAAEQALPAAMKGSEGPVDLKLLLQALLVEVGDVKRTNAMLLEKLTSVEEEVRAVRRLTRGKF